MQENVLWWLLHPAFASVYERVGISKKQCLSIRSNLSTSKFDRQSLHEITLNIVEMYLHRFASGVVPILGLNHFVFPKQPVFLVKLVIVTGRTFLRYEDL